MTTIVLITQQRQNRATELRRQLDLQVNLLVEQKVTKLIGLVGRKLRRDLPHVQDRHDPEVEALLEPVKIPLIRLFLLLIGLLNHGKGDRERVKEGGLLFKVCVNRVKTHAPEAHHPR